MKTSARFLAMLLAVVMIASAALSVSAFSDVTGAVEHATAINVLAQLGVIGGYEDGTFKPEQNVTRAEMANSFTYFTPHSQMQVQVQLSSMTLRLTTGLQVTSHGVLARTSSAVTAMASSVLTTTLHTTRHSRWLQVLSVTTSGIQTSGLQT